MDLTWLRLAKGLVLSERVTEKSVMMDSQEKLSPEKVDWWSKSSGRSLGTSGVVWCAVHIAWYGVGLA